MNYTELKTNVQDICETTFTDDQLKLFTQQTEQKIYNTVQFPALRKNQTGTLSSGTKYLTLPTDFLWTYSLAIISSSNYIYLLNKDVNFMREHTQILLQQGFQSTMLILLIPHVL